MANASGDEIGQQIQLGFTGSELVGKSTLINALMKVSYPDPRAAVESEVESMQPWRTFESANVLDVIFHEIPYADFNDDRRNQLSLICFLINDRFTYEDKLMLERLEDLDVPFLIIRSKADLILKQMRHNKPNLSETAAKEMLRNQTTEIIRQNSNEQISADRILFLSAWQLADGIVDFMDENKFWPTVKTTIADFHPKPKFVSNSSAGDERLLCPICRDAQIDRVFSCGHPICYSCLSGCLQIGFCPICRTEVSRNSVIKLFL